jgi:hypothetical protein
LFLISVKYYANDRYPHPLLKGGGFEICLLYNKTCTVVQMNKTMQFCTKKIKIKSSMDKAHQSILHFILHEANYKNMVPLNWPIIMIGPNNNI